MKIKNGTIGVILVVLSLLSLFSGFVCLIWGVDARIAATLIVVGLFLFVITIFID